MARTRSTTLATGATESPRKDAADKARRSSSRQSVSERTAAEAKGDVVSKARQTLAEKTSEALANYTPEKLIATTMAQMRKDADEIVAKMLGMNNSWGGWEVDHCNGRMSNITNYVNKAAGAEVDAFLKEVLTPERFKKAINQKAVDSILKDYGRTYVDMVRQRVYKYVNELAEEHAAEIIKELSNEFRKQCTPSEAADREMDG